LPLKINIPKNDDLHNTHVVSGIGKSYLTLNNINTWLRSKKIIEEDEQCRLFELCWPQEKYWLWYITDKKRLMQLLVNGGEVGGLRRSCATFG